MGRVYAARCKARLIVPAAWFASLPLAAVLSDPAPGGRKWPLLAWFAALFFLGLIVEAVTPKDMWETTPGAQYVVGILTEIEVAAFGHSIERLSGRWIRCRHCHSHLLSACGGTRRRQPMTTGAAYRGRRHGQQRPCGSGGEG